MAAPLTILVAGLAIAFLANTLSQFSKAQPSTGGFITFVGKTFGPTTAVTTALLTGTGYIIAMSSVIAISGGIVSITLNHYFGWNIPWILFTAVLLAPTVFMMIRGVAVSTKLAGLFFGFEMIVLIVGSIAALIANRGHLSAVPFEPSHITNGFSGLAAGFPLAVYLFIGWENSAALAEETADPRRAVPRAVFMSVGLMVVSYLLFSYATVIGFKSNGAALSAAQIPFITVADKTLGVIAVFAYVAGLTSTVACLIAGTNSQARLVFSAGREGLLPAAIGRVHPTKRTPTFAIFIFVGISTSIILLWGLSHLLGLQGNMDPITFFGESSTMGTILVLVVYLLANLALPFYYRRFRPDQFRAVRHEVLPIVGALVILVPLYYLAKPGQVVPFSWYPYIAAGIIVVAVIYSVMLTRRDPSLGERVGSIVADE